MPLSICARRSTRVPRAKSGGSSGSSPCRITMLQTTRAHRQTPKRRNQKHGQKSESQRAQKRSEAARREGRAPESQAEIGAQGAQEIGLTGRLRGGAHAVPAVSLSLRDRRPPCPH